MDHPSGFASTEEAAGESFRTWLSSSPNNILPSKVLCPCFEQGTSDDCVFLAPQQLKPSPASTRQLVSSESRASSLSVPALGNSPSLPQGNLVSSMPLGPQPPNFSPSPTALPSNTDTIYDSSTYLSADFLSARSPIDFLSSGQSTVNRGTESPEAFFTAALGSSEEKRVERLVKVVGGFSKGEGFSDGLYKRLSGWSHIFWSKQEVGFDDGSIPETAFEAGVAHRLRQLKQVRHKIRKKDWGDTRLWLVFVAHEVEYISQWEHIYLYTSRGVDSMSAAIKMATKYLDTASGDYKRGRNIVQVMKKGGPAWVLEDGGLPQSKWERFMTLDDITYVFAYIRDNFPDLDEWAKSHNTEVSCAIVAGFMKYGWSFSGLLDSNTKVMAILKSYLPPKRPNADNGPRYSEPRYKRWRVDQSGASASLPDHDFLPNSNDFDQATPSRNTMDSTPGSNFIHLISIDAKNGRKDRRRDLIDLATAGYLSHAVNTPDEFIDPATVDNLVYTVKNPDKFTDPATTSNLGYTVNNPDEFTDPATVSNLGCTVNSSGKITDLATADFLQSTDDQSMDALSDLDYGTNQLIDASVVEFLQWTVNGSDELTDPSTDRFLQGTTSAAQLYFMDDFPNNISSLPNTSTPGCIDPWMMSNPTAAGTLGGMDY